MKSLVIMTLKNCILLGQIVIVVAVVAVVVVVATMLLQITNEVVLFDKARASAVEAGQVFIHFLTYLIINLQTFKLNSCLLLPLLIFNPWTRELLSASRQNIKKNTFTIF